MFCDRDSRPRSRTNRPAVGAISSTGTDVVGSVTSAMSGSPACGSARADSTAATVTCAASAASSASASTAAAPGPGVAPSRLPITSAGSWPTGSPSGAAGPATGAGEGPPSRTAGVVSDGSGAVGAAAVPSSTSGSCTSMMLSRSESRGTDASSPTPGCPSTSVRAATGCADSGAGAVWAFGAVVEVAAGASTPVNGEAPAAGAATSGPPPAAGGRAEAAAGRVGTGAGFGVAAGGRTPSEKEIEPPAL